MKNKLMLRTNLFLCAILIVGFIAVSIINYQSNFRALKKNIEHVSDLTSESIYYQINACFAEPVSVSKTMANDSLLKSFLAKEPERKNDEAYLYRLQNYLNAYKEQYGYDSVFLVSTNTNRYYHFSGLDRILTANNFENDWYYSFLNSREDYSLNVDNDEAAGNMITTFVNCKIYDDGGQVLGVVGVGLRIENLKELLYSYAEKYGMQVMLLDDKGTIIISSKHADGAPMTLFHDSKDSGDNTIKAIIKDTGIERETFWEKGKGTDYFMAVQYTPILKWHLIVAKDTSKIKAQFERQLIVGISITVLILLSVLLIVNHVLMSYNERLVKRVVSQNLSQEMEYQKLLREATEEMYVDVYEFDITHGRAGGESTKQFFESLGLSRNASYDEAMRVLAGTQIKEEFRQSFLEISSRENILKVYHNDIRELRYDVMMNTHWENYHWVSIRARLFYWDSDQSVHMIIYSQDITEEKEHESRLLRAAQCDALTGLYNKGATKEYICGELRQTNKDAVSALLIADIDFFKNINDTLGHAKGDYVIKDFAAALKNHFRDQDICGRIGGDEFIVFMREIPDKDWLIEKLKKLTEDLQWEVAKSCAISASIGVAFYPEDGEDYNELYQNADTALYQVKQKGKNGFKFYGESL